LWRVKVRHLAMRVRIRTTCHSNHISPSPTCSLPLPQGLKNNNGHTVSLPHCLPPFQHLPGSRPQELQWDMTTHPLDNNRVHRTTGHNAMSARGQGVTPRLHNDASLRPHDNEARCCARTTTGRDTMSTRQRGATTRRDAAPTPPFRGEGMQSVRHCLTSLSAD
jgi:hypothetical protein